MPSRYGDFPEYVSVAQRRQQAHAQVRALQQRGKTLSPVLIEGRAIARTVWGKAWCWHLERYGRDPTRLPRGRSYARNGAVIDLQIAPGAVTALVQGSDLYEIAIAIAPLAAPQWRALVSRCSGQIDTVVELLSGKLSRAVLEELCHPEKGLFPASREIQLSCNCPDGARLCKHLAAVLYGVGARLDHSPDLLFVLRGVNQFDLIEAAGGSGLAASVPSSFTGDLSEIFGIEVAEGPPPPLELPKKSAKRRRPKL